MNRVEPGAVLARRRAACPGLNGQLIRPVGAFSHAFGVDQLPCTAWRARQHGFAVAADHEDAVGAWSGFPVLTLVGSRGPRTRCRVLGLALCDRPYRTGVRGLGGRLPGRGPSVVIRRAMQGPGPAMWCQSRYSGVRFIESAPLLLFLDHGFSRLDVSRPIPKNQTETLPLADGDVAGRATLVSSRVKPARVVPFARRGASPWCFPAFP